MRKCRTVSEDWNAVGERSVRSETEYVTKRLFHVSDHEKHAPEDYMYISER